MKKKHLAILLLAALFSVGGLFACDEGGNDNGDGTNTEQGDVVDVSKLEGTYMLETLREGEQTYNVGDAYQGGVLTADTIIVALSQDGSAIVSGFGETLQGTWTKDGNTVSVTVNGAINVFTWENGRLTCDVGDGYGWTVKKTSNTVNPGGVGDNDNDQGGDVDVSLLAGTYKFEQMIVKGTTYKVGESYNGTFLTENYMTIALREDGTAYVSMVGEEGLTGTWTLQGDEILIDSNGYVEAFAWENGKIVSYNEPYATLGKVSNTVNPDDFVVGGNGGSTTTPEQGGTNKPESGGGERPGGDNTGDNTQGGTNKPEQDDAVDISVLEGTYHFEQLEYGGKTYKAGESFYGTALTTNFLVIALEKDGTAYVRSSGDDSKGTWQWEDDRLLVDSNNEEMYYKWENGKLISTRAPIMTVGKTSNGVNPDDFGFGESDNGNVGEDTPNLVGEYQFKSLYFSGTTYEVGDTFYGSLLTETYYKLTLYSDGTAVYFWAGKNTEKCTWVEEREAIILTTETMGDITFAVQGDEVSTDNGSTLLTLTK